MKKITIILTIIIGLISCDSLVEEEVFSTVTPNNFFQNEADVATAVNGVYDGIQNLGFWYNGFETSEMLGGIMTHRWQTWAHSLNFESNQGAIWNLWRLGYQAIGRANAVLSVLETSSLDPSVKSRYAAEVRFLRAHSYFNLVRQFGHIPLVTSPPSSIGDAVTPEAPDLTDGNATGGASSDSEFLNQVDPSEVYNLIIEDFEFAEEFLPASHDDANLGKVTSGAAAGMLARVYLTMAGMRYDFSSGQMIEGEPSMYTLAATKSAEVMGMTYSLMENYSDIYEIANNNEVLFSIQYLESSVAGVTGEGNQIVTRTGVNRTTEFTPFAWNQGSANDMFVDDWIANNSRDDNRFARTFYEYYVESDGDTVWNQIAAGEVEGRLTNNSFLRPHIRKFLTDLGPDTQAQNATDYGADWIVLRYADILLMNSEALNESGASIAEAIVGINQVRARAGKELITETITREELREAIWLERKWELCYEGLHYYDCQRTGRFLDEFIQYKHANREVDATIRNNILPIPFNALEANYLLEQNSGW